MTLGPVNLGKGLSGWYNCQKGNDELSALEEGKAIHENSAFNLLERDCRCMPCPLMTLIGSHQVARLL